MELDRKSLKAAFPVTLPVLMGYLSIGIAFGLMLERVGYNFIWAFFMSLTIYAGSGQYLGVSLLETAAILPSVALLTLLINVRHLVYGLSLLDKLRGMGIRKLYIIFALTDETYALLSGVQPPEGIDASKFYFAVALLDHLYWIAGSVIGAVAGALLTFDTAGVEFAMTALFLVIAVEQWQNNRRHLPVLLGAGCALGGLLLFGGDGMLLPALCALIGMLLVLRPLERRKGADAA